MSNEATSYCEKLIADGLEYSAEFVPQSRSRNAKEKPCLNWRVTLHKSGHTITTDYMQGVGHLPHYAYHVANRIYYHDAVAEARETGLSRLIPFAASHGGISSFKKLRIKPPSLVDVLSCLVLDSNVLEYSCFEDWAGDFGYDADSRAAESIYQQCLKTALQLRQIIGLDAAREAFSDY